MLSGTAELESKRDYVSNVMLQKLGPAMREVNRVYEVLEQSGESDEPPDGPPGGLIENPMGHFESQSLDLASELEQWSQWKKAIEHCENRIMWGIYLSLMGIIILVFSLLVGVFGDLNPNLSTLSALLAISTIIMAILSLYPIYMHSQLIRDTNKTWRRTRDEQWGQ